MNSGQPPAGERRELWGLDHGEIAGGGQRFALRLAPAAMGEDGARGVRVLCPESSALADWCEEWGVEVVHARFPPPGVRHAAAAGAAVARLRRLLAGAPPGTIVVANATRISVYCWAAG